MTNHFGEIFERTLRTFLKPLMPYWDDPTVSAIYVNDHNRIWVKRMSGLKQVETSFKPDDLTQAIRQIAQLLGVLLNEEQPFLSTILPNGSELSCVIPPLSKCPVLTIQKPTTLHYPLEELVFQGFLNDYTKLFLEASLHTRQSILIVGPTGSGKSNLFSALAEKLPTTERIISLSHPGSLSFEHPHHLSFSLPKFSTNSIHSSPLNQFLRSISLFGADRLLFGAFTKHEAYGILELLESGFQGSILSFSASGAWNALERLESFCLREQKDVSLLSLRALMASAIQLVVVCQKSTEGKRRIAEIFELSSLTSTGQHHVRSLFRGVQESRLSHNAPVLLPTGKLPSFFDSFAQLGWQELNTAFFNPINYSSDGQRKSDIPLEPDVIESSFSSEPYTNALKSSSKVKRSSIEALRQSNAPVENVEPKESLRVEKKNTSQLQEPSRVEAKKSLSSLIESELPSLSSSEPKKGPEGLWSGQFSDTLRREKSPLVELGLKQVSAIAPIDLSAENDPSYELNETDLLAEELVISKENAIREKSSKARGRLPSSSVDVRNMGIQDPSLSDPWSPLLDPVMFEEDDQESPTMISESYSPESIQPIPEKRSLPRPTQPSPNYRLRENDPDETAKQEKVSFSDAAPLQRSRPVVVRRGRQQNDAEFPLFDLDHTEATSIGGRSSRKPPSISEQRRRQSGAKNHAEPEHYHRARQSGTTNPFRQEPMKPAEPVQQARKQEPLKREGPSTTSRPSPPPIPEDILSSKTSEATLIRNRRPPFKKS